MLRSMWSGVTGLNTHLTDMDVLSNNIANVNTTAYKSQKYQFSDVLYQNLSKASAASEGKGSVNAKQVGLGVRSGSISVNIASQGSALTTDQPLDMMINGSNFFVIDNGDHNVFTRDGSFTLDSNGDLVTKNNGYYVMGWLGNGGDIPAGGAMSKISIINEANKVSAGEATSSETFSGNIDRDDANLSSEDGKILQMAKIGTDGKEYSIYLKLTDAGDEDDTTYEMTVDHIADADGKEVTGFTPTTFHMVYNATDGKLNNVNGDTTATGVNLDLPGDIGSVTLDFSATTNYASTNGGSTIKVARGDKEGNGMGRPDGEMTGFSVGQDGTITLKYSNGATRNIAKIATAEFTNASGLTKAGDNMYEASPNSGDPRYVDVTAGGGSISTGVLEGSAVDLAEEFTTMITAQRGMQANSKVITTSDEMLQTLRDLKR